MRRMMFMRRTFIAFAFVIFAVPAVLSPRTTMAAEADQLTLAVIRTEEMSALAKRREEASQQQQGATPGRLACPQHRGFSTSNGDHALVVRPGLFRGPSQLCHDLMGIS